MTDITSMAPVEDNSPTANQPGTDPVAGGADDSLDFGNGQFQEWLTHGFTEPDAAADEDAPAPAAGETPTPASPNAPAGAGTEAAAGGTPPVAPAPAPAPAADADAGMLAEMLLGPDAPAPAAQPAPAPASAAAPSAAAGDPSSAQEYMPLPAVVNVPDGLAAAIFEADDPNTRKQALGSLLGAFGNALLQLADKRMAEHHVPAAQTAFVTQQQQAAASQAVQTDFYGAFPDLKAYPQIVKRAFQIIEKTAPNLTYGEEVRNRAGNLARKTLVQMGLITAAPAPAAPAAPGVRTAPAIAVGFEAGGARPAGSGASGGNTPADLLAELSQFS